MTDPTTQDILIQRRIQLYNIKAKNAGGGDVFGRSALKEKELQIERTKLAAILSEKYNIQNVDDILVQVKK